MTEMSRPSTPPPDKPSTDTVAVHPLRARPYLWKVLAAIALVIVLFWFGVYKWNWHGVVTRLVSKVVPYPAAIVDGSAIRWSDFEDNVLILEKFYDKQKKTAVAGSVFPSEDDLKKRVLDRLIRDQLVAQLAVKEGVSVSNADVNEAFERLAIQEPGTTSASSKAAAEQQAAQKLEDTYGISARTYKDLVLRPLLLRQKLETIIAKDDKLNAEKSDKAKAAAAALHAGKGFKETAIQYSEDPNLSVSFGERGLIGPGLMPPEVDKALTGARTGDIIGPIKSALGYHVLKIGEIKEVSGVRKITVEEVVVYPIKLDDWLEAQVKKTNITTFIH